MNDTDMSSSSRACISQGSSAQCSPKTFQYIQGVGYVPAARVVVSSPDPKLPHRHSTQQSKNETAATSSNPKTFQYIQGKGYVHASKVVVTAPNSRKGAVSISDAEDDIAATQASKAVPFRFDNGRGAPSPHTECDRDVIFVKGSDTPPSVTDLMSCRRGGWREVDEENKLRTTCPKPYSANSGDREHVHQLPRYSESQPQGPILVQVRGPTMKNFFKAHLLPGNIPQTLSESLSASYM
jgi:hypothetical protein